MQLQLKRPVYRAIAQDLRVCINDKHQPGDMLPSENELSDKYNVNRYTIRHALDLLSRENLIRRHNGRGSVVLDRKAVGEFAVALKPACLNADAHPYYNYISGELVRLLQERNPRWQVKLHIGKRTATPEEFPATLDLLAPDVLRNLRGVFAFHPLYEVAPLLQDAKVPVVVLGNSGTNHVGFDKTALFNLGLAQLKESGCKTVGMIHYEFFDSKVVSTALTELFRRAAAKCGLRICPEWTEPYITTCVTEQNGYDLMMQFWKNRAHPDGLLVVDDMLCRGVLRASVQLGIEFPRDVRLVTYANRGISLHYHKPVSRVEHDLEKMAQLAVDMMMALMERRPALRPVQHSPGDGGSLGDGGKLGVKGQPSPSAIDLPGVLIKGETT